MGVRVQLQWLCCELEKPDSHPDVWAAEHPNQISFLPLATASLPFYSLLRASLGWCPHLTRLQSTRVPLFTDLWLPESWGLSASGQSVTWDTSCREPWAWKCLQCSACLPCSWSHTSEYCFLLPVPPAPALRWALGFLVSQQIAELRLYRWDPQMQVLPEGLNFSDHLCVSVTDI